MSVALVITGGYGNGTLVGDINDVVTRGYTVGAANVVAGGKYNAAFFFPSGQIDVTLTLYDQEIGGAEAVPLDDSTCLEVGTTGLYVWDMTKITTTPIAYKEYVWVMTDGATSSGGVIAYDDFFSQYLVHSNML